MKGIEAMSPISVVGRGKPFVTRAEIAMLAGSAIVTIGIATMPSLVQLPSDTLRSSFRLRAADRPSGFGGGGGAVMGVRAIVHPHGPGLHANRGALPPPRAANG